MMNNSEKDRVKEVRRVLLIATERAVQLGDRLTVGGDYNRGQFLSLVSDTVKEINIMLGDERFEFPEWFDGG